MNNVKLVWATPDSDANIACIARVSTPKNQKNESIEGLLRYMMREKHISPFEMVNACFEITTTRDIGRQILRHRSFSFQEFSQRYSTLNSLPISPLRECRMQDDKNRQNSLETSDKDTANAWVQLQEEVKETAWSNYVSALSLGIAKEQARVLLPEGLTTSRMYMNGTMRSWINYLQSRLHGSTQKEHREIAQQVLVVLRNVAPVTINAFFPE